MQLFQRLFETKEGIDISLFCGGPVWGPGLTHLIPPFPGWHRHVSPFQNRQEHGQPVGCAIRQTDSRNRDLTVPSRRGPQGWARLGLSRAHGWCRLPGVWAAPLGLGHGATLYPGCFLRAAALLQNAAQLRFQSPWK